MIDMPSYHSTNEAFAKEPSTTLLYPQETTETDEKGNARQDRKYDYIESQSFIVRLKKKSG
jgi:hypothetical protein